MSTTTSTSIKGLVPSDVQYDGSPLRVAIVHARWNKPIIDALVGGAVATLRERGVHEANIVVQSVPGSYELPLAVSKVIAGSHVQSGASAADLLGGLSFSTPRSSTPALSPPDLGSSSIPAPVVASMPSGPFDAVIAIGVLIKGATMHFEYICETVSNALMRVQLDTGVPVVFGVLTALTEEQALERAGLGNGVGGGHNHGEDWGLAAVEMGVHSRRWGEGKF